MFTSSKPAGTELVLLSSFMTRFMSETAYIHFQGQHFDRLARWLERLPSHGLRGDVVIQGRLESMLAYPSRDFSG